MTFGGTALHVFSFVFSFLCITSWLKSISIRHQDGCSARFNICKNKDLWLTFHAGSDELHAFIVSYLKVRFIFNHRLLFSRVHLLIRMFTIFIVLRHEWNHAPYILSRRYRNPSSRLPLSRLENSFLCKMEISAPLSIPLMTHPPLCCSRARLCLLFVHALSDCCVRLLRLTAVRWVHSFLLPRESRLHALAIQPVPEPKHVRASVRAHVLMRNVHTNTFSARRKVF